ncbi:MAG TPA: PIN domain-containing protein [Ktedonobacteraceae bacterium]|jgi:tRNA(fMet)-specific endonuclease VapC|nr:PIN domain-containing protein [Ktedonobacteraceae bacterium]
MSTSSSRYLLDSSVLILSLKQDAAIQKHLIEAKALYVSAVALGELYYGAAHSVHVQKSLAEVDQLAKLLTVLSVDSATARVYGHIKHEQRMKGQMRPENDLWIAATAMRYGLTLAARDHHFTWIAGLHLEEW